MPSRRRLLPNSTTKARAQAKSKGKREKPGCDGRHVARGKVGEVAQRHPEIGGGTFPPSGIFRDHVAPDRQSGEDRGRQHLLLFQFQGSHPGRSARPGTSACLRVGEGRGQPARERRASATNRPRHRSPPGGVCSKPATSPRPTSGFTVSCPSTSRNRSDRCDAPTPDIGTGFFSTHAAQEKSAPTSKSCRCAFSCSGR